MMKLMAASPAWSHGGRRRYIFANARRYHSASISGTPVIHHLPILLYRSLFSAFPLRLCASAVKWFRWYALATFLVMIPAGAFAQDAAAGKEKAVVCGACHGADGNSTLPQYPILAGQTARYIYLQLRDFKEGRRKDPLMSPMAANLSKKDMLDLGAWFSAQKPTSQNSKGDSSLIAHGKAVADAAICTMCHLGGFSGQNEIPQDRRPALRIRAQATAGLQGRRRRTNDAGNMTAVLRTIPDEDLVAVAAYVASLD
jgi:cytochrome c553